MSYLIAYFVAGLIFAFGLMINGRVAKERRAIALFFTVLFWPLLLLVGPEIFLPKTSVDSDCSPSAKSGDRKTIARNPAGRDKLQEGLSEILFAGHNLLSDAFKQGLLSTSRHGQASVTYFPVVRDTGEILEEFWGANIPPAALGAVNAARSAVEEDWLEVQYDAPDTVLGMQVANEDAQDSALRNKVESEITWLIGFSNQFLKSISKTDAKLRGRILNAVGKISSAPTSLSGDTIKPLSNVLAGMWRYRIGDYRLVYFPDEVSRKITLLYFGPRASIYSNV